MFSGYLASSTPYRNTKRQKMEGGGSFTSSQSTDESFDRMHKVSPSPVVHIRGLSDVVTEGEIRQYLEPFGTISYCMSFPNKSMALVEFENLESAKELVRYAQEKGLRINGKEAQYNFSKSSSITRSVSGSNQGGGGGGAGGGSARVEHPPNNVLLLTVLNVQHPITVDVIHAVCKNMGNVDRIVIFRRNGVQAMVEFDCEESATRAKAALSGADIYANCCTLKIEYAKPTTLNVKHNTMDTWDYTVGCNVMEPVVPLRSQPLLPSPMNSGGVAAIYGAYGGGVSGGVGNFSPVADYQRMDSNRYGGQDSQMMSYDRMRGGSVSRSSVSSARGMGEMFMGGSVDAGMGMGNYGEPGCVLMVYGMAADQMNCDRLFNLLCLFGNVVRIKFLKSKDGWAMAQMGDHDSCQRIIQMLNGQICFGKKLEFGHSKQTYITETSNQFLLFDSSPSYSDYTASKNNRFNSPDAAVKNRFHSPCTAVYFYNAPPNLDEQTLIQTFLDAGASSPTKISMLTPKSEKSSRGMVLFDDIDSAMVAIICANNTKMKNPSSRGPYVMKLAFTTPV